MRRMSYRGQVPLMRLSPVAPRSCSERSASTDEQVDALFDRARQTNLMHEHVTLRQITRTRDPWPGFSTAAVPPAIE